MSFHFSSNQGDSNNTNEQNENEVTKQATEFYFVPVLKGNSSPGVVTDSYNMKNRMHQPLSVLFVFQAVTVAEGFL